MQWKPCLRACIKFCPIFYTFHSVWLNFPVIDVHTNILNYIPCTFARSGNTFSRMFCQVVYCWAQPDIDGSIDWFWPREVDRLLGSQNSDRFVRCEKLRLAQMNFFVFRVNSIWNLEDDFTAFNWRDRDAFLFAFGDHAPYNCRLLAWDSLYQQVRTSFLDTHRSFGARGGAVSWGTALHTERSRVRLPMVSLGYFIDIILTGRAMALGLTEPLTEMSTRNISWAGLGGWCVGLTTFTAFISRLPCNLGTSTPWNPRCMSRPLQGLLYLCFYIAVFSSFYIFVRIISCWEIPC
jgi:hypothetical protein